MLDIFPSSFSSNQWERDEGYEKIINHGSRSLPLCVGLEKKPPTGPALARFGQPSLSLVEKNEPLRKPRGAGGRHHKSRRQQSPLLGLIIKRHNTVPTQLQLYFFFPFSFFWVAAQTHPLTSTSWDERLLMIFHFVCGPEGNSRKHCVARRQEHFSTRPNRSFCLRLGTHTHTQLWPANIVVQVHSLVVWQAAKPVLDGRHYSSHLNTKQSSAQSFQETYRLLGATKHKLVNKSKKEKRLSRLQTIQQEVFPVLFLCPKRKKSRISSSKHLTST